MERKLIKQGGGGFTIYLPKKWLDRKGLKEGDNVKIIEKDASLIIGSSAQKRNDVTIKITQENKIDLQNILTHVYRKGYDKIKIEGFDKHLLKQIKNITEQLLLGFEITDQTKTSCMLENISEPTGDRYDMLIRKLFLIIKETQELISGDFERNKFENLKEMQILKSQQDKYILFSRRLISKELFEKDTVLNWEMLTFLTHIQHAYLYLYKYASENKVKKDEEIMNYLKKLEDYFDLYFNSYYKQDINYIHKINKLKEEFQFRKCLLSIEKSRNSKTVVLSYIREIFRLIQIGTSPIMAMILKH